MLDDGYGEHGGGVGIFEFDKEAVGLGHVDDVVEFDEEKIDNGEGDGGIAEVLKYGDGNLIGIDAIEEAFPIGTAAKAIDEGDFGAGAGGLE